MEDYKRGDIIIDKYEERFRTPYLILRERENSFHCLDTRDLEPVAIGKAWINQYAIIDSIDINKVINFLKEE